MLNPIARHLDRLLDERDEHGVTVAERIADKLVECSLAGDHVATRIILDAIESYDPTIESAWSEDQDQ